MEGTTWKNHTWLTPSTRCTGVGFFIHKMENGTPLSHKFEDISTKKNPNHFRFSFRAHMERSSNPGPDLLSVVQRLQAEFTVWIDSMDAVWDLLRPSSGLFRTFIDSLNSKHCQTMFFGKILIKFYTVISCQNGKCRTRHTRSWQDSGCPKGSVINGESNRETNGLKFFFIYFAFKNNFKYSRK